MTHLLGQIAIGYLVYTFVLPIFLDLFFLSDEYDEETNREATTREWYLEQYKASLLDKEDITKY